MAWSELERFEPADSPGGIRRFTSAAPSTQGAFVPHVRPLGVDSSNASAGGAEPPEPAPADLDAIRREAYMHGEAAGRAQLPWADAAALKHALAALEKAASALSGQRRSDLIASRHGIIDLACAISERILARTLALDRSALAGLVGQALASFEPDEPLHIALAPDDLEVVRSALSPQQPAERVSRVLHFVADASLESGDARVRARRSDARATVDLALERLRAGLEEQLCATGLADPGDPSGAAVTPEPSPKDTGCAESETKDLSETKDRMTATGTGNPGDGLDPARPEGDASEFVAKPADTRLAAASRSRKRARRVPASAAECDPKPVPTPTRRRTRS